MCFNYCCNNFWSFVPVVILIKRTPQAANVPWILFNPSQDIRLQIKVRLICCLFCAVTINRQMERIKLTETGNNGFFNVIIQLWLSSGWYYSNGALYRLWTHISICVCRYRWNCNNGDMCGTLSRHLNDATPRFCFPPYQSSLHLNHWGWPLKQVRVY